jgi:hypothetical protein
VNLPPQAVRMAFSWVITAVVTSPPSTGKTLVRYRCHALFSQVNSDLDDIFLDRAASALHAETAFHDRVELLPDACQPNERFRYAETVTTRRWLSRK